VPQVEIDSRPRSILYQGHGLVAGNIFKGPLSLQQHVKDIAKRIDIGLFIHPMKQDESQPVRLYELRSSHIATQQEVIPFQFAVHMHTLRVSGSFQGCFQSKMDTLYWSMILYRPGTGRG
jgi:hypothetical protein